MARQYWGSVTMNGAAGANPTTSRSPRAPVARPGGHALAGTPHASMTMPSTMETAARFTRAAYAAPAAAGRGRNVRGQRAGARFASSSTTRRATLAADAGFCPVIRRSLTTT